VWKKVRRRFSSKSVSFLGKWVVNDYNFQFSTTDSQWHSSFPQHHHTMAQLPPCATLGQFAQNQPQKRRCCFPNRRATSNVAKVPSLPSISLCQMYRFATSLDYLLITIGLVCSAIVGLVWPVFYVLLGSLLDDLAGMIPTTTSTSSTSSPAAARLLAEVLGAVAATAAAPGPPGGRPGGGPGGFTPPGGGGGFPVPGGGAVPGGGGLVPSTPFTPAAAAASAASPEMEAITQNCLLLLAVAAMGFVAGSLSLSCLMYTTERQCNAVRVAWVRSAFAQDATWYGAHNVHQLGTQMSIDIAEYYKGTGVRLFHPSFATHTHTHTHIALPTVTSFPPSPPHHLFRPLFSPSLPPPLPTRSTRSSRPARLIAAPIAPLAQERLSTLVASLSGFVGGVVVGLTAGWQLSLAVMFICPAQFFIVRHFAKKVRVEMRSPNTACSFYYPHPLHPSHHTMICLSRTQRTVPGVHSIPIPAGNGVHLFRMPYFLTPLPLLAMLRTRSTCFVGPHLPH
jgi:ABC-type multidrug transport system fused ATPase/permease subunit